MIDISSGGAAFMCRQSDLEPPLGPDEPLTISLAFGEGPLELKAVHRHTRPLKSGAVQIGMQFAAESLQNSRISERIEHLITVMETRLAEISMRSAMMA